jgi:methionyl aminopeptidase
MVLKTKGEIELMDEANRIVHRVLDEMGRRIAPGATPRELDQVAERMIRQAGGVPAFLRYRGYPATLCISINEVIVHGIPDDRRLGEGDIVGIDCGVLYKGYYGDAARTYAVGEIGEDALRLLRVTEEALHLAVAQVRPGGRLSDIGYAVQRHAERHGYSVVREFSGHGVGSSLHEDPQVPNYGPPGKGPRLRPGLVLAIEPMVNAGTSEVTMGADGWTARTADGSLSAHFEYSVAVTDAGARVLGTEPAYHFAAGEPERAAVEARA